MIRLSFALTAAALLSFPASAMVGGATPGSNEIAGHVVAVFGRQGSVCTGTAIAPDLILTAGHCVHQDDSFDVMELNGARKPQPIAVTSFEQHPQYRFKDANAARPTADIALLKLAHPLSARVTPAAIGERDYFPAGDHFMVAGFGSVGGIDDGTFGRLLAAELIAVPKQYDLQLRLVDPTTRGQSPGLSACSGDSGGPVFDETRTGLVLIGVVSWGASASGTTGCGGITGATPLPLVRNWISETAKKLGSPLVASTVGTGQPVGRQPARTQGSLSRQAH
jgi:secreted trypsin-like serine protease